MPISKEILGLNARNFLYLRKYNKPSAKKRADDKLATKRVLIKNDIPTAELIHAFSDRKSLFEFNWQLPETGFVIKPARGYIGEGILVFTSWHQTGG